MEGKKNLERLKKVINEYIKNCEKIINFFK